MRSIYRRLALAIITMLPLHSHLLDAQQVWTSYTNTDEVRSVLDDGRTIWAGTGGGVVGYDIQSGEATVMTTVDGLRGNNVFELLLDRAGTIWVRSELGVSSFAGGSWKRHTFRLSGGDSVRTATKMALDSAGRVIVIIGNAGATRGIARFDGASWSVLESGGALPAKLGLQQLLVDRQGRVWAGGLENASVGKTTILFRITGDAVTTFRQQDGLPASSINGMAADSAGMIWLSGGSGVSRYDGTAWTLIAPFVDTAGLLTSPLALAVDVSGGVWVGGMQGIDRYDGSAWRHYSLADGLPGLVVRNVVADAGGIWASIGSSIARYQGGSWKVYDSTSGLPAGISITSMRRGVAGALAATSAGIARFDGTSWRVYRRSNVPYRNNSVASAISGAGELWTAYGDGGIDRFDGNAWRHFTVADGLIGDSIYALVRGRSGEIWASGSGGINRFDGERWQSFTPGPALRNTRFISMAVDSAGNVWAAGSDIKLYRFDGAAWQAFTSPGAGRSFGFGIGPIAVDPAGKVWVASLIPAIGDGVAGDGLFVYDGSAWNSFKLQGGWTAPSGVNPPMEMMSDRDGKIWFAFDALVEGSRRYKGGIANFDGVSWRYYRAGLEIPLAGYEADEAQTIALDSTGAVWFGSRSGGIVRFDGRNWTQYTQEDGLAADAITSISFAPDGSAWIGTGGGVTRITHAVVPAAAPRDVAAGAAPGARIDVAPNPAGPGAGANIVVTLVPARTGDVRLTLRDVMGRELAVVFEGSASAGQRTACRFDTSELPSGTYYLHLESDGMVQSERLVLMR